MAAAGEPSVIRLVYVGEIPRYETPDSGWIYDDPDVQVSDDGTIKLVEGWWHHDDQGQALFTGELADYMRRVGRRTSSVATLTEPQTAAAWTTIPTTVLLGHGDDSVSVADREWAKENLADVRFIESDHFIIFRHPSLVTELILESFG
jgi:pimeloyl-ACP methyl ester carboxylesterase